MNPDATIVSPARRTATDQPSARRRFGLAVLTAALLGATACGTASTGATTTVPAATSSTVTPTTSSTAIAQAQRPTATFDRLVGAQGARVHVRCAGHGATTVLLIAGFGGDTSGWAKVEPVIATRARVCSYDRPGTGTSDPATSAATFATEATDLHALLTTIGEPGPYVAVGHSFGGAEAVTFASRFPAEVAGLVLVDASPTTWPAALCAVPDDGSEAAATAHATCATFAPTGNGERLDVAAAFAGVASIDSLGSLPMAVVTATTRTLPAGLAATDVARLTTAWDQGQQAWAALTTDAHVVPVAHTGHHIELDQPGVVIDEITRLLP